jgi:DNA invertase Pin-like site-specific DNA recombinase
VARPARAAPAWEGARPSDVVMVTPIDRLTRSTFDLFAIVKRIVDAGGQFQSLTEPRTDTSTSTGGLMIAVLGGLADVERDLIRTRMAEGRSRPRHARSAWAARRNSPTRITWRPAARRAEGATLDKLAASLRPSFAYFPLRRFRTNPAYFHEKDHLELLVSGARSRTSFS